ncbi:hypothetical protein B0H13DRAFT_1902339 [Mycena leptocephala]|nr:hypothetical protein B0H13DRAFT_1902339 [Mycena leptocephala]
MTGKCPEWDAVIVLGCHKCVLGDGEKEACPTFDEEQQCALMSLRFTRDVVPAAEENGGRGRAVGFSGYSGKICIGCARNAGFEGGNRASGRRAHCSLNAGGTLLSSVECLLAHKGSKKGGRDRRMTKKPEETGVEMQSRSAGEQAKVKRDGAALNCAVGRRDTWEGGDDGLGRMNEHRLERRGSSMQRETEVARRSLGIGDGGRAWLGIRIERRLQGNMTRGDSPRRSRRSVQADSDKQTRRVVTDSARADGVKIGPGREHQARVKGSIWDGRARVRAAHAAQGPWGVDVVGEGGATRDTAGRRGVFSQPPAAEIFNDNTSSAVRNMDPTCPGYTESVKGLRTARVRMTWAQICVNYRTFVKVNIQWSRLLPIMNGGAGRVSNPTQNMGKDRDLVMEQSVLASSSGATGQLILGATFKDQLKISLHKIPENDKTRKSEAANKPMQPCARQRRENATERVQRRGSVAMAHKLLDA